MSMIMRRRSPAAVLVFLSMFVFSSTGLEDTAHIVENCAADEVAGAGSLVQREQLRSKRTASGAKAPDLHLTNSSAELARLISETADRGEVATLFATGASAKAMQGQPEVIEENYTVDVSVVPGTTDVVNSSNVVVVEPQDDGTITLPDYLPKTTEDGRNITYIIVPAQLMPPPKEGVMPWWLTIYLKLVLVILTIVLLVLALAWCLYKLLGGSEASQGFRNVLAHEFRQDKSRSSPPATGVFFSNSSTIPLSGTSLSPKQVM